MPRWEYRVVSLRDGQYTSALNEYAREGWELMAVTPNPAPPAPTEQGRSLPMPRTLGRIEEAASRLNQLGGDDQTAAAPTTSLLWVLRRYVDDD